MKIKKIALREAGYWVISILLVVLSYMVSGTFFRVWIRDLRLLIWMAVIYYCIIGFYRILNHMARKYRDGA